MSKCALAALLTLVAIAECSWIASEAPATYPTTRNQNSLNNSLWGDLKPPYPTNAWWGNLVYAEGLEVVCPLPYMVKSTAQGLIISYPKEVVGVGFVLRPLVEDLRVQVLETVISRFLLHYDELTVSMRWRTSEAVDGLGMVAHLARGSPYITLSFHKVRPVIHSVSHITSPQNTAVTGTKFRIMLNNGQTWIIYSSSPTTLTFGKGNEGILGSEKFFGVFRIAVLLDSRHEDILDRYCDQYPTSGSVEMRHDGDSGIIQFHQRTASMSGFFTADLITLVLPHHIDAWVTGPKILENSYETIKGKMTGVIGTKWFMFQDLPPVGWSASRRMDPEKVAAVRDAVHRDQFRGPVAIDVYQFAKQLAGLGRVALIADELGEQTIACSIREKMKGHIEEWFEGVNLHNFLYDEDWGGLITSASLQNTFTDFGNAVYNDHHYQYGYLVYAAAVISRTDTAWIQQNRNKILELVRDYANPLRHDRFYPYARHFDFYLGHSWAGGLWAASSGKNQESTSEAVNSYYAVHLLGLAMEDHELSQWGRMLMAMEIRSAKKYWHIMSTSGIYPEPFASNKIVGILWSSKVDHATWFGPNVEYIHCIQYLPFTPVTEYLLDKDWMQESYPVVAAALTRPDPVISDWWKGYIFMAHAIIEKEVAWLEAQELEEYDHGNSESNTLYWISTRPPEVYNANVPEHLPLVAAAVS